MGAPADLLILPDHIVSIYSFKIILKQKHLLVTNFFQLSVDFIFLSFEMVDSV